MKKFLSLVLALVMTMSLVTVSAGAKDFTDDDTITYDEAVAVISAIGVVDGYTDGSFKPTNTLTRQAAAKIICNMILGPTTAAELSADTAPYSDVPTTSEFAGYIAYCQKEGIISGYADGTFRPGNTLTGYAFMKMLLGALGYDQTKEGYTGANWSINVAKQAIGVGLNSGLTSTFNGVKAVTREEAALYAFNTLKADLVEYGNVSASINGTALTLGSDVAQSKSWGTSATKINNIKVDNIIQFAEQYFPKLKKADDTDDFMRPAYTWTWKGEEIGTYVDWTQMVQEYTAGVTGKELYNLLTASTIKDYSLDYYVNGAEVTGTNLVDIEKNDLYRTNTDDVGMTGRGVLTQVFVDNDNDEIVITSINTYLAKANADYSTKSESISLQVYDNATGIAKTVDVDDVPGIENLKEDDIVLVQWASDDVNHTSKVVKVMLDADVLDDVTVTKFSKSNNDDAYAQPNTDRVTSLTTSGTEYKNNVTAWYEDATLGDYDGELLTNKTYDVYLDQYGYFIGAALHSGDDQYVFIAARDINSSALGLVNADAMAIFTDGTMEQIKVNTKDTNKNIDADGNGASDYQSYDLWSSDARVNRWFTYSVDNGVYTLKPVTRWTLDKNTTNAVENIKVDKLSLTADSGTGRSYGNDNSIYITVTDDTNGSRGAVIDDVTGVYTGIEGTKMTVASGDWVCAVYDKNSYIIAAIVLGEAEGAVNNYAYILTGANSEARESDGTYYWTFDAILNGTIQTMTIKSKYVNTVNSLYPDTVEKLIMDADGYVTRIDTIPDNNSAAYLKGTNEVYGNTEFNNGTALTDYYVYDVNSNNLRLSLDGRTLHLVDTSDQTGVFTASGAKAVVRQTINNKTDETEYATVKEAYSVLADADNNTANGLTFNGRIVAILDGDGVAQWVFFDDNTPITSGTRPSYNNNGTTALTGYSAIDDGVIVEVIKQSADGVYSVDKRLDTAMDVSYGAASDYRAFKFTTTVANVSATLMIKNSAGTIVFAENDTFASIGGHFFYVQVTGNPIDNHNGSGSLTTTALTAGTYTWSVTTGNGETVSGSFVI